MENPAQGGASECRSGRLDGPEFTRTAHDTQAAVRAIEAGLICLPKAIDMATILRRRLDSRQRLWLSACSVLSLSAQAAEELAEAALADIRGGPPDIPFESLRDEIPLWAIFASRAERCCYLAAAWKHLGQDDRRRFLRKAT